MASCFPKILRRSKPNEQNCITEKSNYDEVSLVTSIKDDITTSISLRRKKTYGEFLICRPFKRDNENGIDYLIGCLHNRISLDLENVSQTSKNLFRPQQSLKRKRTSNESLFDTLIELINEYDAAAVGEIFRLLLERRTAIPLFLPTSKQHFLPLIRNTGTEENTFGDNILLGEDTTLMRVVVISCRQKEKSQSCEILDSLFHIHSMHTEDFNRGSPTSSCLTAEIGIGCFLMEEFGPPKVQNVLVIHVVGDFKPLWPFLLKFVDFLLIEDATNEKDSFYSLVSNRNVISKADLASVDHICLWKPSFEELTEKRTATEYQFDHDYIECALGEIMNVTLSFYVQNAVQEELKTSRAAKERMKMHLIPILSGNFTPITCPSPTEIESSLALITTSLKQIKKIDFTLQQNFRKQAIFEEAVYEHFNNSKKKKELEFAIEECLLQRKKAAMQVKDHPLLSLFQNLLSINNPSSRVLSIRMFEKSLAKRSHREQLLENHSDEQHGDGDTLEASEIFSIEYIWREMSVLHSASSWSCHPSIEVLPRLAAQHLVDGFSLELVDGDSNVVSMHMEWIKHVFRALAILIGSRKRERIFVLSVMGIQSSGKSTLLNTMFGIQLRTSVGRCTRGINMQLLAVEGRPEYDYILLLDTEGSRAPEYHGLPGSEKRDNQMAAFSILLADATIIVIPGENDAAIKEILPVVKLAYQGSKLADENGGQLNSKMFFVYNRIDSTQKEKLNNVVKSLGTSLNEAFNLVQNLDVANLEVPFRGFKLDTKSKSFDNDVCILGNVKTDFEPPGDVPNSAFGEALVELHEHIHRRVTASSGDGPSWRGRSFEEFSKYIEDVWQCICSANFTLSFVYVMECIDFNRLDRDYKVVEQKLAEEYRLVFERTKKIMAEEKGKNFLSSNNSDRNEESLLESFEVLLRDNILPTQLDLDKEVSFIIKVKSHEKWSLQYQELWESFKINQSRIWALRIKTAFNMLFKYEHHVDECKKKFRQEIVWFFGETVLQSPFGWSDSLKKEKFIVIYDQFLTTIKEEFPIENVPELIAKVYESSNVIKKRQIEFQAESFDPDYDMDNGDTAAKSSHLLSSNIKRTEEQERNFEYCSAAIYRLVNKFVTGKLCYDDSIISSVIFETDVAITSHHVTINSDIRSLHILGRQLVTESIKTIQDVWEADNSVYAKLQQKANREALFDYFTTCFSAVEKTNLFSHALALEWQKSLSIAFEDRLVRVTSQRIPKERWFHDSRLLQKHMDLHLVGLLEKKKDIKIVLRLILDPTSFREKVLKQLIAKRVPNIVEEFTTFANVVKGAVQEAAIDSSDDDDDKDRAQQFIFSLRDILLNCGLQRDHLTGLFNLKSNILGYCDRGGQKYFLETCVKKLNQIIENYKPPQDQKIFAKEISQKVIAGAAALPLCDAFCPLCFSMCCESANHDMQLGPHDAVHQPLGILGVDDKDNKLIAATCSQRYSNGENFECPLMGTFTSFKEFSEAYPDWKLPLINEELPLREYILYKCNDFFASHYDKEPCSDIPPHYIRDLPTIRAQLEKDLNL